MADFVSELHKVLESDIYTLVYDNKVRGFRVKLYNTETYEFDLYDFTTSTVEQDKSCAEYLVKHKGEFGVLPLVSHNSLLMTEDEVNGVVIKECKSVDKLIHYIKLVIDVRNAR